MQRSFFRFASIAAGVGACSAAFAGPFHINLVPNSTLSGNAPALAAFQRAAQTWESKFTDPITIQIDAGLASLGGSTIGSTASVALMGGFSTVRDAMVADAADEPLTNGIVASLPTAATFSALVPSGFSLSGSMTANKANLKALGFTGLDATFGASDGAITFSSDFSFDFDNSDGVGAGQIDFETTALHEIGHLLGFVSVVDDVDVLLANGKTGALSFSPLDMFRFQNNVANRDPSNAAEFTNFPRYFLSGGNSIFDDTTDEYRFSTGRFTGDGNQASHWKDDAQSGINLGIMDPTLNFGVAFGTSAADLRAFDLIGYDLAPVPEPGTMVALGVGVAALLRRRRKA